MPIKMAFSRGSLIIITILIVIKSNQQKKTHLHPHLHPNHNYLVPKPQGIAIKYSNHLNLVNRTEQKMLFDFH